jgi:hypothetical protein
MYRDAAATYEEFGLRFRRATQAFVGAQIELSAGDGQAAERELQSSTAAFADFGAATSATTHRALLAEVVARLGRLDDAAELAQRVAAEAASHDLLGQVLWRCALARVRVLEGSPRHAVELTGEARRLLAGSEFPWLATVALTVAADAASRADDNAEAARLLAEARAIAEAKGDLAGRALLDSARIATG